MSRVSDATRLFISRNYVPTSKNSGVYARIFACVANLIFAKQCICSTIEDNKAGKLQQICLYPGQQLFTSPKAYCDNFRSIDNMTRVYDEIRQFSFAKLFNKGNSRFSQKFSLVS
jgi:hypothetical protein